MLKKLSIVVLVVFGFFMTPSIAFACKTKSEKSCCKKEASSKTAKAVCCSKGKNSKEENHEGCSGACKSVFCGCSALHLGITALFCTDLNRKVFRFSSEKQNYHYSEIFISSDFRSVWLPPKIS